MWVIKVIIGSLEPAVYLGPFDTDLEARDYVKRRFGYSSGYVFSYLFVREPVGRSHGAGVSNKTRARNEGVR